MTEGDIQGCHFCADPLHVSLQREYEVFRLGGDIAVFRCPQCACLILDDILGWKGSGVVFRATKEMILRYAVDRGVPAAELAKVQDIWTELGEH